MKKIDKFLAIALSACTLFAVGCNDTSNKENDGAEEFIVNQTNDYEDGIHERNYVKTSDYLVKDKQTEYAVLIPANASLEIEYAVGELKELFLEATSAQLLVVRDEDGAEYADKKFISLGNTTLAQAAGVAPSKELDQHGYAIQTVDKNIYIVANTDFGITFGVYGFLEMQFNYECFSDVCYVIEKQDDAFLYNYDVREVPDFKIRLDGSQYLDGDGLRRMGYTTRLETWANSGTSVHNTFEYVDPDEYANDFPEWFNSGRTQLCYTARGDAEKRDALLNTVCEMMVEALKAEPNANILMFGNMDKNVWCGCDACGASLKKYGTNAAVQIQFVNELAEKVQAWMETEDGLPYARDFDILCLAYQQSSIAPVTYDKTLQKWVAIDESVVPGPHTQMMFAPLDAEYHDDIYSECNEKMLEQYHQWQDITESMSVYNYFTNYNAFWFYNDSYVEMKNLYQVMAQGNIRLFYEEGQQSSGNKGGTAWTALRNYASSKLAWNVNLDFEALTKRFFENYYDAGAEILYETFLTTRAISLKNQAHFCASDRKHDIPIVLASLWPEDFLRDSLNNVEIALSKIAYLKKVNPVKYQTIYNNIISERIFYEYALVELYGDRIPADELLALKLQTKQDAQTNGCTIFGTRPKKEASEVWADWGI